MIRRVSTIAALQVLLFGLGYSSAHASIIHTQSGLSSAGVPVSFVAELTISGDILTVTLTNDSPVGSLNPNDILGSYYFDVLDADNNRPLLTYASASGDVYSTDKNAPDQLQTANANLMAVNAGDYTWQFRTMDSGQTPFLGFGIGTVGNSSLSPNNFQGNIVDGMDYAIYRGDVTTSNLNNRLLVKETATYTFTGLTGFTEADITDTYAFGLGTAPDSLLTPEPATALLLAAGAMALLRRKRTCRI